MFEPLDTSLIEQRLRETVPDLSSVEGGSEYSAIRDLRGFRSGTAYVVLAGEKRVDNPDARPGTRQAARTPVESTFGVIIAARNYNGRAGEQALKDVMPLIGAVRTALVGWPEQDTSMRPIAWQQGDVLDYNESILLWIDVFTTQRFIGGN